MLTVNGEVRALVGAVATAEGDRAGRTGGPAETDNEVARVVPVGGESSSALVVLAGRRVSQCS